VQKYLLKKRPGTLTAAPEKSPPEAGS
jgi:hypothetical protein